jgi:ribosomal protein S18 acetylase RimI-like enzyme
VQTLVRAFADDPVVNHLFPVPEIRARGMAHVFKMALRSASRLGAMDVIPPDQAAAIWLQPEHPKPGLSQMFFAGALATPFLVGWQATRRMLGYERFVEELRFQLMGGRPHWYLFAIGIEPDHQGRGLGSTLLAAGRQRATAGGFPCYLETSNERNLAFYRKNGFTVVDRRELPGAHLNLWSLISEGTSGDTA